MPQEFSKEDNEILESFLIPKARRDILSFTKLTKTDYQVGWHHRVLSDKLNAFARGEIRFLMVFMPPRHGKSELVSRRFPAFLHGLYPDAEIMAASYLDSLAGDMTIDVQNVIDSPMYKKIFPDTKIWPPGTSYTKGTRNSSEHHIVGRRGKYRGQGVGGSFTGKGANFIIIDDPIKGREIADSQAFRERLWNFYNNDLFSRLETDLKNGRLGQILITLTRWHEDDLAGRLLDLAKKKTEAVQWDVLCYPAIREDMDNKEDPRQIGEALWPEKYGVEQLAQIRASAGDRAWGSLYQQDPTPAGASIFNDSMFEFVDTLPKFDWMFTMGDTAYEEKQENDFHCFTVFGVVKEDLYVVDVYLKQIEAAKVEMPAEKFIRQYVKYGYRGTYIEPKGHGIYLNQKFAMRGLMIPTADQIKEFYSDRRLDKVERANNVVPHLSHRKIKIYSRLNHTQDRALDSSGLKLQCLRFPKTKNDDFVDTVVDGLKLVYGKTIGTLDLV